MCGGVLRRSGLCSHGIVGKSANMGEHKPETGDTTGFESRAERSHMRRDPRADPDDEPASSRVDVYGNERVERSPAPPADSVSNAALTLRRELAKLHQQAAAVERTLEEQRR